MLLNKLESGFLRFETPQGSVAVEPTFWERVYLLWTFRNFRQLSLLLLNARQTALINRLFLEHAAVVSEACEPRLEIGVVEDFVPPAIEIDAVPGAKTGASPAMKAKLPEQAPGRNAAPVVIPIGASLAMEFDGTRAAKEEKAEEESAAINCVKIAPEIAPDRSFSPIVSWLRLALSNLPMYKLVVPRRAMLGFGAAVGALLLCVCSVFAWHRIAAVSDREAHNSPPQRKWADSPSAPKPAPAARNPVTAPEVPAEAVDDPEAADKAGSEVPGDAVDDAVARVKPSPAKIASPITATRPMMTPERESRGATARVARSNGGPHSAAFSRVRASISSRGTTLAPGSRGAMTRSAQSYFDLAKQQLRMGNYSAATANYQRAWRIEEISAAAKGRQARARRAMQAKNEIIANRR